MTNPIGPLTAEDEGFNHQIVDTFAVVGPDDLAWTEKVCAMAAARDGSLQLGFGLGKYNNRNVMDAYAGISRASSRSPSASSRALGTTPNTTVIGPIRYEVVEPLRSVRFVLEPNDVQPIAFDWLFEAAFPPAFEDRTHIRARQPHLRRARALPPDRALLGMDRGRRRAHRADAGHAGCRPATTPGVSATASACRLTDLEPRRPIGGSYHFFWTPSYLERPDGSAYGVFMVMNHFRGPGLDHKTTWGTIEHPDGRVERMADIVPELAYDPVNRRLRGGRVHCTMADGSIAHDRGRGRLRHRLPPRHRPLLRLRRPPPRRMARRAPRRWRAHRRLLDARDGAPASTRSVTRSFASPTRSAAGSVGGTGSRW